MLLESERIHTKGREKTTQAARGGQRELLVAKEGGTQSGASRNRNILRYHIEKEGIKTRKAASGQGKGQ